jgi:hypothetical protein
VQKRASAEHVAEMRRVLMRLRLAQQPGALTTRTDSALLPTFCLACDQEMPTGQPKPPPHMMHGPTDPQRRAMSASRSRAKLLYGREPENAQRRAAMQHLKDLGKTDNQPMQTRSMPPSPPMGAGRPAPIVRPGSAPFKRSGPLQRPPDAVLPLPASPGTSKDAAPPPA